MAVALVRPTPGATARRQVLIHLREPQEAGGEGAGRHAARRILADSDGARQRLARDLHDGAQQKFVTAVIDLQLAQAKFTTDPQRSREHLDAALRQSQGGLAALRDLIAGMHPPILTHAGLRAAVNSLADGFPIPLELDIMEQRLPWAHEESVYFFISEALTNVIRHAHATLARVGVWHTGDMVLLVEVVDDGVGGASLTSRGSGLPGLVDRVEALGGELVFSSPAEGGTVIRGLMPLPASEAG
jgi:signal transduction histidine kinase